MAAKLALDPVADLKRRLARLRTKGTGAASRAVHLWWSEHGLGAHPAAVGKRIALALLEQKPVACKHAGILVLHELLAEHLRAADLPAFARMLAAGHLADTTLVDDLAVKVLGTMLHRVRGRAELARVLATWRTAETPWQRRAACVAFTALAPQGDSALGNLTQLIFVTCATIVWSPERIDQSAVGWVLRELSRAEPTRVEAFVRRNARLMSRECVRAAVEKLPAARQHDLLAHWKRATTPTAKS